MYIKHMLFMKVMTFEVSLIEDHVDFIGFNGFSSGYILMLNAILD